MNMRAAPAIIANLPPVNPHKPESCPLCLDHDVERLAYRPVPARLAFAVLLGVLLAGCLIAVALIRGLGG